MAIETISWLKAEPSVLKREHELMAVTAPLMSWVNDASGGWKGVAPEWPFPRDKPEGLREVTGGKRLQLEISYTEAFPVVPPKLFPVDPLPSIDRRVDHSWHLNGDGSLCLLRNAYDWRPGGSATDLIVKASGWFIEYMLMEHRCIERMSEVGFYATDTLDEVVTECSRQLGTER